MMDVRIFVQKIFHVFVFEGLKPCTNEGSSSLPTARVEEEAVPELKTPRLAVLKLFPHSWGSGDGCLLATGV